MRVLVPVVYLAVSLRSDLPSGFRADMLTGVDRARRRLGALFGVAGAVPIPASQIEALIAAEERT